MREALRAALRHGFVEMGLNRIEAMVYPENLASLRLLQHLGFQKEGLLRQSTRQGERFYDHWLLPGCMASNAMRGSSIRLWRVSVRRYQIVRQKG